jgi:hypothetical protein
VADVRKKTRTRRKKKSLGFAHINFTSVQKVGVRHVAKDVLVFSRSVGVRRRDIRVSGRCDPVVLLDLWKGRKDAEHVAACDGHGAVGGQCVLLW